MIRKASVLDLSEIMQLQYAIYCECYYESREVFANIIKQDMSYVFLDSESIVGYIMCHMLEPKKENLVLDKECKFEDGFFFVHDLAVLPSYRKKNVGSSLVKEALLNIEHAHLVAVNGTENFWKRFGFVETGTETGIIDGIHLESYLKL